MQYKGTAYTVALVALVVLLFWETASAQSPPWLGSAVEGAEGRLLTVRWEERDFSPAGGKAVHLVVEARPGGDERTDLQWWDRVGQQLARAALNHSQGASAAHVSIYYGEGTRRYQPALELVALPRAAGQEPYRQKGYMRPFHAAVEGFSSSVVVLVKYRFDVFALLRQSLVAVPALKGRP